jgi:hypothetical protein
MDEPAMPRRRLMRLLAVNLLYTFIASSLSVMVPLYLLQRQVSIGSLGLILAIVPLSFMVLRIIFASMADGEGTGRVGAAYSAASAAAIAIYMAASSTLGFALANFAEGVRSSAFWAVVRTEVIATRDPSDVRETLTRFSNYRQLADGIARLSVGFLIAYLAFSGAFLALLMVSLLMAALVVPRADWEPGHGPFDGPSIRRIFRRRPQTFWYSAFLQTLIWLAYNMMTGFLLPVYLTSSLGLSYVETGTLLAVFSLATGLVSVALMRLRIPKRRLILLTLASVPALALFPFAGADVLPPLLLLSFGCGCSNIVAEYILADQVFRSKDVSTDIGVLYVPLRIAEFLFLSLGGLAIAAFGYVPPFAMLALSIALFVWFGRRVIRSG